MTPKANDSWVSLGWTVNNMSQINTYDCAYKFLKNYFMKYFILQFCNTKTLQVVLVRILRYKKLKLHQTYIWLYIINMFVGSGLPLEFIARYFCLNYLNLNTTQCHINIHTHMTSFNILQHTNVCMLPNYSFIFN